MLAVQVDELDEAVATQEIIELAEERGRIFAGLSDSFAPVPGWNGQPLADLFRQRYRFEGDTPEVLLTCVFVFLFERIFDDLVEAAPTHRAELIEAGEGHLCFLIDLLLPKAFPEHRQM